MIASLPSAAIFIRILISANSPLGAIGASITKPSKSSKNFNFSLNLSYFAGSNSFKFTPKVSGTDLAVVRAQASYTPLVSPVVVADLNLSLPLLNKTSDPNPPCTLVAEARAPPKLVTPSRLAAPSANLDPQILSKPDAARSSRAPSRATPCKRPRNPCRKSPRTSAMYLFITDRCSKQSFSFRAAFLSFATIKTPLVSRSSLCATHASCPYSDQISSYIL